jgi:hypothetical protein
LPNWPYYPFGHLQAKTNPAGDVCLYLEKYYTFTGGVRQVLGLNHRTKCV